MIMANPKSEKQFNGLIIYILWQLKGTIRIRFLCYIQDLHDHYQDAAEEESPSIALFSSKSCHYEDQMYCYNLNKQNSNKEGKTWGHLQHQEQMFTPLTSPTDTKTMQGKTNNWCEKCNMGKGQ